MPLTESALRSGDLIWLVSIDYAGRTWRFASSPCEVEDEAGRSWPYGGGLDDLEYEDAAELLSGTPPTRSISLDLLFPEDIAVLVARGHDLAGARGEVSVWVPGTVYENRVVLLDGVARDPEYGGPGEPVGITIEDESLTDTAEIPTSEQSIGGWNWIFAADSAVGLSYPMVFGTPGVDAYTYALSGRYPGSPAPYVDTNAAFGTERYLLIAGHSTEAGAEGGDVDIYNATLDEWQTLTAEHVTDDRDQTVTVVEIFALTIRFTDPWADSHDYYCGWTGGHAALLRSDGSGPVRGAGDLVRYLLDQSNSKIDRGRTTTASRYLNRLAVSGYIDDPCSPLEWIAETVVPLLPISLHAGPEGLYPLVWRWDARRSDAVARVVVGEGGIVRSVPMAYEGRDEVRTNFTLEFAVSADNSIFRERARLWEDADKAYVNDMRDYSSYESASLRVHGDREESMESSILWEQGAAASVLLWRAAVLGGPRRSVTLQADLTWAWLQVGDVVTYTDSSLGMAEAIGLVRAIKWTITDLTIEVVFLPNSVRDLGAV